MTAQIGSAVLLQYGRQAAQQPGSAVLLSYGGGQAEAALRQAATIVMPWRRARGAMRALNAVYRSVTVEDIGAALPWGGAAGEDVGSAAPWSVAARTDDARAVPWVDSGIAVDEDRAAPWNAAARRDDERAAPWGSFGAMLNEDQVGKWLGSAPADEEKAGPWAPFRLPLFSPVPYIRPAGSAANFTAIGGGIDSAIIAPAPYVAPAGDGLQFVFGDGAYAAPAMPAPERSVALPAGNAANFIYAPVRVPVLDAAGNQVAAPSSRDVADLLPWGLTVRLNDETVIEWRRYSRQMDPGWGVVTPPGPVDPQPGETIIIPVRRFYIVQNEIMLTRVSDGQPIPALNLSVSFDCDSWLPTFSATIPESVRALVMPGQTPVEVRAYINGSEFVFLVEKIGRSRAFAKPAVTISGRGIAAELDAPFAAAKQHSNASVMTAQQLIGAALEYTTYSQTWNIDDWLVPAGVLAINGTPAAVAAHVAEAAGAVLAADWSMRDLRMLPRYPVKPWEWNTATPAYVIPSAVTETESVEWIEKPAYNAVYVAGVEAGIVGQVKRAGTAGDKPAPMVTHPLCTHADAARQRGTTILSDTGRKALLRISMPVLESTGVIDICRLIEFSDGANTRRGIVRANEVSVQWPQVRQTLTIEAEA